MSTAKRELPVPTRRRRGWRWTLATAAILVVYLFPIYWMVVASVQPGATSADVQWLPSHPGLQGYAALFSNGGLTSLQVSILISLGSVALTLLVSVPAAYALSRLRSRAVGAALILLLLAQMIPSIVLANSFYALFNGWGLLNSYAGLILADATLGVPFTVILMRSFMLRLDTDVM
jgi:multiple sugar transport system permease protein